MKYQQTWKQTAELLDQAMDTDITRIASLIDKCLDIFQEPLMLSRKRADKKIDLDRVKEMRSIGEEVIYLI